MGRGPLHARNTASVLPHADNMRQAGCTATSERPGAICPGHKRLSWVPTELQLNTGFIPPSCCLITGGAQKIFDEQEKVRTKKHTHWAPLQVWMPSSASHWTHRPGQARLGASRKKNSSGTFSSAVSWRRTFIQALTWFLNSVF